MGESGGKKAERGDEHGHHDGTEAKDSSFDGGILDGIAAGAHLVDALQHDDAGLDGDAEEGKEADTGGDTEVVAGEVQRDEAANWRDGRVEQDEEGPLERIEHAVKDDEDQQDSERANNHQTAGAAFLAGILAGPVEVVAGGQLDLLINLVDGFFDGTAEVAI